ncbi:MAG: MoaD/ThiS family protein [Gammaproteobacteria bacterium]|nr:MoaD/ThiS family protein [Gammaproteobacteria bacterium]
MIKVLIPYHLQTLAGAGPEVKIEVPQPVSVKALLEALEAKHPELRGAVIDYASGQRRPKVRFFACKEDLSHQPLDQILPDAVISGQEPFIILGAISGG